MSGATGSGVGISGFRAFEPNAFALLIGRQKFNSRSRKCFLDGQNGGNSTVHHTLFQPGYRVERSVVR
jgi:hypothetical protein